MKKEEDNMNAIRLSYSFEKDCLTTRVVSVGSGETISRASEKICGRDEARLLLDMYQKMGIPRQYVLEVLNPLTNKFSKK